MTDVDQRALPVATRQDGTYPRPQLMRAHWHDLSGTWAFAFDDEDAGLAAGWQDSPELSGSIRVPFPPESPQSGVGDTGLHRILWYSRHLTEHDLVEAGAAAGGRTILHFGAVDYRCRVWIDGSLVGSHEGGHTPFRIDITEAVHDGGDHQLVVRAEDDPSDVMQPRGKQDWQEQPHVIWYHRTSGIWQPVWLETVPALAIEALHWTTDVHAASVQARIVLTETPHVPLPASVTLRYDGEELARTTTTLRGRESIVSVPVAALTNGQAYEQLLWSPEAPRLLDAVVEVGEDRVSSYVGLRTAAVRAGRFVLNDRPYYVRSVLNQGYWPQSHLAAPSPEAIRAEAELIKDLGFNATRVHQKFEDPRFLYWADRLGLLVWGEAPGAFAFSPTAIARTVREWLDVVERDFSHPSIVTWVPMNESWGVQHISHDARMQHYARSLVELTRALDPTRPVVSNDGWEQVDTDILAIHDYESDPEVVRARYADRAAVDRLVRTVGPAGRSLVLSGDVTEAPVMLTEFGGISFEVGTQQDAWGYSAARTADDFAERLTGLLAAVHDSRVLAGFCYTQLTDTLQETNGLVGADRVPKISAERIRAIVTGAAARP
jgi:beta-galactosidase/beta-glucuronidase